MPAHNEQVHTPTLWQHQRPHVDTSTNQEILINRVVNEDRLVEVVRDDYLTPPGPVGRPPFATNEITFVVKGRPGICILDRENIQNLEKAEEAHLDGKDYTTRYSLFISVSQQRILSDAKFV